VHLVTLPEEMPVSETLETAAALEDRIGIDSGPIFANAVYPELLTKEDLDELAGVMADGEPDELVAAGKAVGLRLDTEDLDALLGYARFLTARREIQGKHLKALKKGTNEPVMELPFLFTAGLDLPGIELIADSIEERVAEL